MVDPLWYRRLCKAVGTAKALDMRPVIESLYRQRWRKYHNFDHINQVLAFKDLLQWQFGWEDKAMSSIVDLAIVFHDIIYAPGEQGCELASTRLLDSFALGEIGVEAGEIILHTSDHQPWPGNQGQILMCDADLLILAQPGLAKAYRQAVKQEVTSYARANGLDFTPGQWRRGRADWIAGALSRPKLFHGPGMEEHEEKARKLLRQEQRALDKVHA